MGKLQDYVRECIVECKTRAEINTQSKAEVLLDKFAQHLDENGTGGGVSSWNDLTDKPFGEVEVEILPETSVQFEVDDDLGMPIAFLPERKEITSGQEYKVIYNDVTYNCVADANQNIGNVGMLEGGEDTGEPFIICLTVEPAFIVPLTEISSATVSVKTEKVETISPEYLPNDTLFIDFSGLWSSIEGIGQSMLLIQDVSHACTMEQIRNAIEQGKRILIRFTCDLPDPFGTGAVTGMPELYVVSTLWASKTDVYLMTAFGACSFMFRLSQLETGTLYLRYKCIRGNG